MFLGTVCLSFLTLALSASVATASAADTPNTVSQVTVPPPAKRDPPPISVYGSLPGTDRLAMSPSGNRLAAFLNKGDQKVIVLRRLDGDKGVIKTVQLNDRVGGAQWADDEHLFVYTHRTLDTGTDHVRETSFLYLINLKTGTTTQVAPDGDFIAGLPELVVRKDGHLYGFFQGDRYLIRQDLDTLAWTTLAKAGEDQGDFVLTAQGDIAARMEFSDRGKKWKILKGLGDPTVLAQGEAEVGGGRVLGLGRTPTSVLVANDENGTLSDIREYDLTTGKASAPLVEGVEANPIHSKSTRLLEGFELDGFVEDIYFLDESLQAKWESVKAAFKGQKVRLSSRDAANLKWVVSVSGPSDSGHYYLVDLGAKQAIPLGARYPDIPSSQVGRFDWIDYKAADGKALKALVTLPPGQSFESVKSLPAVVLPHGGPQARDNFAFDWWAQALASRGYVVIQPQYRGSGGYGQAFEREGWGQWGRLMQTDVSDALKAMVNKGWVDPGRVCIVGWSYGGYATMAGVTLQNGIYRCAAAGAGVYDLNSMLVWNRDRFGKLGQSERYWKTSMALKSESDPAGALVSPAKNAANVTVPVLLIHGRQDTTVPIEQSEEMAAALRAAGKNFEYVVLENETHHIETGSIRTKMLESMIGFVLKYNPPN
eukprot:gene11743-11832_t